MINKEKIIEVIQKHLELPENTLLKLAGELYDTMRHSDIPSPAPLGAGDLEELLVAIQKLKEIHSTITPSYTEDVLYVDQLKQLEFRLSEVLFKTKR